MVALKHQQTHSGEKMKKAMFTLTKLAMALSGIFVMQTAAAEQANRVMDAVADGQVKVNMRYRYEFVDQDGIDKNANASTLRTRLTYNTQAYQNFSLIAEVDNVSYIGNDNFNSTANGKGEYPVVADPKGTDVNQIALKYRNAGLSADLGRQRIVQDGQRFIGGVAWRQNEQTFDGVRLAYEFNNKMKIDYAYIHNVNRIFGPEGAKADLKGDIHLVHGFLPINESHKITTFLYEMDFRDALALSNQTLGVDYNGVIAGIKLHASYATQTDTGDSPLDYSTDYLALDATYKFSKVAFTAGFESLGSDNSVGFQTPLATLHKFQGFADKFLSTPKNGINDRYVKVAGKVSGGARSATYHIVDSAEQSIDYGSELDLTAKYKFNKRVLGLLKYAHYSADEHASDTSKVWAMVNVNF